MYEIRVEVGSRFDCVGNLVTSTFYSSQGTFLVICCSSLDIVHMVCMQLV